MPISKNRQKPMRNHPILRMRREGQPVPAMPTDSEATVVDVETDSSGNIITPESSIPVTGG